MEFKLTISDTITEQKRMRINISRLALQTGYNPSHISRVFSKKINPSLKCISSLAEALKMDITNLDRMIREGGIDVD